MSTTAVQTATTTWTIDHAHSHVAFAVKHLMISTVRGEFRKVSGTVVQDELTPANGRVEVRIAASSIDTREPQRDAHLRSADFFDAERFPALTFVSRRIDGRSHRRVHDRRRPHDPRRDARGDAEGRGRGHHDAIRGAASAPASPRRQDQPQRVRPHLEPGARGRRRGGRRRGEAHARRRAREAARLSGRLVGAERIPDRAGPNPFRRAVIDRRQRVSPRGDTRVGDARVTQRFHAKTGALLPAQPLPCTSPAPAFRRSLVHRSYRLSWLSSRLRRLPPHRRQSRRVRNAGTPRAARQVAADTRPCHGAPTAGQRALPADRALPSRAGSAGRLIWSRTSWRLPRRALRLRPTSTAGFYYPPFFSFYGWYPYSFGWYGGYWGGWYGYPYYGPYWGPYDDTASVRLHVTPRDAQVYVDGYYAGVVDDFDGTFQRLRLLPGAHEVTIWMPGYRSATERMYFRPTGGYKVSHILEKLAAGQPEEPKPQPTAPPATRGRDRYDRPAARTASLKRCQDGRRTNRGGRIRLTSLAHSHRVSHGHPRASRDHGTSSFGSLVLRVQPSGAAVSIDGERWQGPDTQDRLVLQLSVGRHHVEIRKDGYTAVLGRRRGAQWRYHGAQRELAAGGSTLGGPRNGSIHRRNSVRVGAGRRGRPDRRRWRRMLRPLRRRLHHCTSSRSRTAGSQLPTSSSAASTIAPPPSWGATRDGSRIGRFSWAPARTGSPMDTTERRWPTAGWCSNGWPARIAGSASAPGR